VYRPMLNYFFHSTDDEHFFSISLINMIFFVLKGKCCGSIFG
jgi:hypothetical protein